MKDDTLTPPWWSTIEIKPCKKLNMNDILSNQMVLELLCVYVERLYI